MEDRVVDLPESAVCARCGYSIHALTVDRCPECGMAFDPEHVLARLRGEFVKLPFDLNAAKMLSSPPWWATVVALIACVICSISGTIWPSVNHHTPPAASIVLAGIAMASFLLRLVDHRHVPLRYDMTGASPRRFGINWIVLPAAIILFFACARSDLHSRIAFEMNRAEMNALVRKVAASPAYTPDQRVGLYDAVQIYPTPDGMNFRIRGHTDAGFVFTTTGQAPTFRNDTESWGGGWYAIPGE